MIRVKVITQPTVEPVTRAEVKTWVRVASAVTTFDTTIDFLITAAREICEIARGEAFYEQTLETYLDYWPLGSIELPRATPLKSITFVKYTDRSGIQATMPAADYIADTSSPVGRVTLQPAASWPSADLYSSNPIVVRYVAGQNASPLDPIPAYIRLGMRQIITHHLEHPSGVVIGDTTAIASSQVALTVSDLLRMGKRVYRF